MKKYLNRKNIILGLIGIVLLAVGWDQSAATRGRWVAQFDLARGHYRILAYGLPPRGVVQYKQILQERYGVEYQTVALCIVSRSLVAYADAYDNVSGDAIKRKYGQDVFKKSWDEATRTFDENHKAELKNVSRGE
jgi:hypothetical protein